MAKIVKKSFDAPEETRSLHKGKIEAVDLGVSTSGASLMSRDGAGRSVSNRLLGPTVAKSAT